MALGNSQPAHKFIFQREFFYPYKQILADDARHNADDGWREEEKTWHDSRNPNNARLSFLFGFDFIMKNFFLFKPK